MTPEYSIDRTALYRLFNEGRELLYVGIAFDPHRRWSQHVTDKPWWPEVFYREVAWYASRREAEGAEIAAIRGEFPKYNRVGLLGPPVTRDVVAARKAYEQAQQDARTLVERARINLGRAIHDARRRDVSQDAIAKELGLTREQVRRFQREYESAPPAPQSSPDSSDS